MAMFSRSSVRAIHVCAIIHLADPFFGPSARNREFKLAGAIMHPIDPCTSPTARPRDSFP